jgi:glycerophosphoryl diester phosphodiesterase
VLVIAHRGRCGALPENALEALPALPAGVDGVEVDVRTTRDGVPVLLHDPTVDRTTEGSGKVADLRAADLYALRRVDGGRVPTLVAYLRRCRELGIGTILLDLKAPSATDLGAVVAAVQDGSAERCILLVRGGRDLAALRSAGADLRLGLLGATRDNVEDHLRAARRSDAEIVFLRHGDRSYLANREVVPRIQAEGRLAGASTVNRPAAVAAAVDDGCGMLLTDVADQLARPSGGDAGPVRRSGSPPQRPC